MRRLHVYMYSRDLASRSQHRVRWPQHVENSGSGTVVNGGGNLQLPESCGGELHHHFNPLPFKLIQLTLETSYQDNRTLLWKLGVCKTFL